MIIENEEIENQETVESKPDNVVLLRDLGPQPIVELMQRLELSAHRLVEVSPDQLTHKMVARAMKGRRLTSNSKAIVQRALNKATGKVYTLAQLFNYR